MIALRLVLLMPAIFLVLACAGNDTEPTATPPLSETNQSEVTEWSENAQTETVEATATSDQEQADEATEVALAPTPTASVPPRCQLVRDEPGQLSEVELQVEVIADGLEIPWGLAVLPTGDLLVTERPGRVRLIQDGEVVSEPVLEFGVSMPPPLYGLDLLGSEGGLLGVLLPPSSPSTACSTSSTT